MPDTRGLAEIAQEAAQRETDSINELETIIGEFKEAKAALKSLNIEFTDFHFNSPRIDAKTNPEAYNAHAAKREEYRSQLYIAGSKVKGLRYQVKEAAQKVLYSLLND